MPTQLLSALMIRAPFATLFPVDAKVRDALMESIREHGFDPSKPLDVWGNVVVDGHTRLQAAAAAGLTEVPVFAHDFPDEDAALEYAIRNQRDRRNLAPPELASYISRAMLALDQRKQAGARTDLAPAGARSGKSAAQTADLLGVSPRTVERARTVLAEPEDSPARQAMLEGETTVNGAYGAVLARRQHADPERRVIAAPASAPRPAPALYGLAEWTALPAADRARIIRETPAGSDPTFNRTNDNVEWALWTWNPVTGCDHGCVYCYARDIANRFYSQGFAPTFLPSRLQAPRHMQVPAAAAANVGEKNVFVCSMADLFGKWVPQEWIDAVFAEVVAARAWNFLFLTKFPQRLAEQAWPANAWVGTTVDTQARVANAERSFAGVQAGVKWLSCEPLLERLTFDSLAMFDWVVLGGQSKSSQAPEFQPPWEWVEHLIAQARAAGCQVYMKPNLKTRPREYPTGAVVLA